MHHNESTFKQKHISVNGPQSYRSGLELHVSMNNNHFNN